MDNSQPINIAVGNNSNFQFQISTKDSVQTIDINGTSNEDLLRLVQKIKTGIDTLQEYLHPSDIETLKFETNYLENHLKKSTPDTSLLKAVTKNIWDILKAVPSNVIANLITNNIQP
ncbi:MAG: hypothetical protein ACT4ON_13160 [Bacteroidota bacterium]